MNNIVVVVFPDEARAHEGLRALQDLHREGNVAVYATALLQRELNGELLVKRDSNQGPLDVLRGLGDELTEAVQRDLTPGTSAVIGEVSEESIETIDDRMKALGGKVTRDRRKEFVAGFVEEDTAPIRTELAEISAEHAGRKAEVMETKFDFEVENAKQKLQRAAEKLRERVDRVKQEMQAKLDVLADQAAGATPEVRDRIQQRIAEVRKDLEQREEKLQRAYELTHRALD